MKQADEFTAANYDPEYWAQLIKDSGARYTVITTKHHDGFALWDTKAGDVSAVKSSAKHAAMFSAVCRCGAQARAQARILLLTHRLAA